MDTELGEHEQREPIFMTSAKGWDGILVESLKALVSGRVILPCVSMAQSHRPHLYRLIIHPDTKMRFHLQRRIVH